MPNLDALKLRGMAPPQRPPGPAGMMPPGMPVQRPQAPMAGMPPQAPMPAPDPRLQQLYAQYGIR